MRAIKREDLENINFYQTPKWLFDLLLEGKITPGAYATYILMYDRTRLSSKNNWIDKFGDVYIKYSYEELLLDLKVKSNTQIKRNLAKLLELNLIDKKRNFNSSTTYYLNIYDSTQIVPDITTQIVPDITTQIVPDITTQIVQTSNNNIIKNKTSKNNIINNKSTGLKIDSLDISEELKTKLNEFICFRKEIKKPIKTMASINKMIESLGKDFSDEIELMEAIDNSIMNGWQGVFPIKNKKTTPSKEKSFAQRELERIEREERLNAR